MRRSARILSLLLLVFVAGPAWAQDGPKPAKKPGPKRVARALKVGVVDIGVLFKSYKRKDILESAINDRREQMRGEIEKGVEKVKDMRFRLEKSDLRPGSEPYQRAADDIQIENYKLKIKQENLQKRLKKHVERQTLQILKELQRTIEEYGQKFRYDLILKIDRAGRDTSKGELYAQFQEEIFRAQISDILYFSRALDITLNVEKELNKPKNLKQRALEASGGRKKRTKPRKKKSADNNPK
jgi:Skp family chaperone for outer membrane proteins